MNTKLNHVQDWLELAQRGNWSVSQLASTCGVSVRTLETHFLKHLGQSPKNWMNEQRNRIVIGLLKEGFSVKETAAQMGYKRAHHFSRDFKRFWGVSPTQLMCREKAAETILRK